MHSFSLPIVAQLLGSKQPSDILEAIEFFVSGTGTYYNSFHEQFQLHLLYYPIKRDFLSYLQRLSLAYRTRWLVWGRCWPSFGPESPTSRQECFRLGTRTPPDWLIDYVDWLMIRLCYDLSFFMKTIDFRVNRGRGGSWNQCALFTRSSPANMPIVKLASWLVDLTFDPNLPLPTTPPLSHTTSPLQKSRTGSRFSCHRRSTGWGAFP